MAPSLQELIDFLLNEVALCGNQGAALSEVLQAVEDFYRPSPEDETARRQTVDHRFKAKVWLWLTRHPEVSVGNDSEWNHLSLDDVLKLNRRGSVSSETLEQTEASNEDPSSPIRIFVSRERTWYAIAGHEPDETKVPASEFELLSIIASRKSRGIPQTELVRLSGQDKRSVPKRTDSLQKKGYIQKRPVQVKSARTSLCTLGKFVKSLRDPNATAKVPAADTIDFQAFTKEIFEILRKHNGIIARNDMKRLLGFEDRWRWRILSRALRKLERIGVTKRVKAASQYEKLHPCVMLIREPTEKDIESFTEFSRESFGAVDDQGDLDEDMDLDANQRTTSVDSGAVQTTEQRIVDTSRTVPSWNPDRNIHNQVFDIIDNAGEEGITNIVSEQNINRACFGTFYRRPTENLIHRLVDCWQISQPPHLRHLAIVRDSTIERTILYYIHYSARNFTNLVEAGTASWEAVEFPVKKAKTSNVPVPPIDAPKDVDVNGFPRQKPRGLVKNGRIGLFEGLMLCRPTDYSVTSSDPTLCRYADGSTAVVPGHVKSQGGQFPGIEVQDEDIHGRSQFSTPVGRKRGRPKGSTGKSSQARKRPHQASPETPNPQITGPAEEGQSAGQDDIIVEENMDGLYQAPTRSTKAKDKLKHLPRKERFEALGMDETWTEYNALTMEKPTPGVYITPQGKRRPAGKKQGRPKRSRIAVFKSPKLRDIAWFVNEKDDSDDEVIEGPGESSSQVNESLQTTPIHPRAVRRNRRALESDQPSPSADLTDADGSPSRARKRPRFQRPQSKERADQTSLEPAIKQPDPQEARSVDSHKRPATPRESREAVTPKRPRFENPVTMSPTGESQASVQGSAIASPAKQPMDTTHQGSASTAREPTKKSGPAERGGSISILRRKIIMEIVEKAGGAYPSGNEIWYPFTAKWKQASRKETPDMRTIRTAIKYLVDTGKLRQLTFSGKDSNGMMVTRTILTKPGISPDDPIVKDMQAKQLASKRADHKTTYSSNVDTNPEITRSRGRSGVHKHTLPLVTGATVQLQTKPASVRAEERRRERKIQRELLKRLEKESAMVNPRVGRLMTIQRHSRIPSMNLEESINLPTMVVKSGQRPNAERLVKKISTIGWYSMSMNPQQRYHPGTGTFGTFGTFAPDLELGEQGLFQKFRSTARKQLPTVTPAATKTASIGELADLARESQDFHSLNDRIAHWELGHEQIFDAILAHHPFIEQGINDTDEAFHAAPIGGTIRFADEQGGQKFPSSRPPMMTRKRGARLQLNETTRAVASELQTQALTQPTQKPAPTPRQRNLRPLSDSLTRKFMVALVAVRSLAGGSEGRILDWDLVRLAFPKFDAEFVRRSANRIIAKSRLEITKMQRDFQERFLQAYEEGIVPPIDYNRLDQYDWPAVVEWASKELDISTSDKAPSLPATREQFDSIFYLREEPITLASELYKTATGSTLAYRRDLMARTPFAVPVDDGTAIKPKTKRQEELAQIEVTKTWVRANVITPDEIYDSAAASKKLATFGDRLLTDAAQSLLNESVISAGNRGRVTPGRNYEPHEFFRQQLDRKRAIDRDQLRRAVEFKTETLDPQLRETGSFSLDYHATDGDILALINLIANGRIELWPLDPPRRKFGLLNGSYLTRQMDKSLLRFEVEIRAHPSYVYGNPVKERVQEVPAPSAPALEGSESQRKIPLWYAIHDGYGPLLPGYWERALASVLGCVDARPGASAQEISRMTRPILGAWEIELLLDWLTEVGLADRHGDGPQAGWTLREWWWMVLG
ncbi:hypothetical protein N7492_006307 [Penicillium capsulatum]|uniref:TFIIIC transcription initiation factor complex subunits Tfc3 n=1 Tax=Penicillium capsulatum TaxID=69766 RepID=A0A9W9I1A6_9EURO|nr:hypothetical protein N7492_006307 [Penicillium capsulatum]